MNKTAFPIVRWFEEVLPRVCSGLPGRPLAIPEKRPKGIYKEDLNT